MSINFADATTLSSQQLEEGDTFAPRFNADGFVSAIAVEASSGTILMLAHMNAEALSLTLETGMVHYYSRSRAKIWKKGETSGETQKLIEMRVDCDQDAVLLIVEAQGNGAACHTGRKSCFFRKVEINDEDVKLADLGDKPLFDPKQVYS